MINAIPWWMKIGLKTVWSRLPVDYSFWKKLGLFRHGLMDKPDYVNKVFSMHWNRVQFARKGGGCSAMELGCGDSLASCQVAKAFGVEKYTMVDAGPFASMDMALYKSVARKLRFNGVAVPEIDECGSVPEMLQRLNAEYLTAGLKSLRAIPAKSVDFIWSQAVLEHVRRAEFFDTMKELRRIMRDDGVASHRVDLRDHLGGALNNLRFPEKAWESPFMSSSGFYTNRIQFSEMLHQMRNAGFDAEVIGVTRWDRLPTPREKLAREFRAVPEEDLLVNGFDVILRPA
ncbi:methyltransferase domain-containing protein [Noviherbaspirillum sp. ST9]|uniref:class I SAM-dependent methyltransferase n=1 Tax=Noviherbaspirillum sp. ST9 TaxID=3401606 RepID=UPI003B58AB62